MSEKELLSGKLNIQFRKWRRINLWIDRTLLAVLLLLAVFVGSGLIDGYLFLKESTKGIRYHSFSQLTAVNPDTAAWLIMDGTYIDHPVVKSKDNFDYLDKGFDGSYYAGGTLFLDKDNSGFEDPYCMIHGHHMAAGAMFGDLPEYLDEEYFTKHPDGTLLTPHYDYDLRVFAAGIFNAYDRSIYQTGDIVHLEYIKQNAVNQRDIEEPVHVLALSTCLDDMTDNRAVVFCAMSNRRAHR